MKTIVILSTDKDKVNSLKKNLNVKAIKSKLKVETIFMSEEQWETVKAYKDTLMVFTPDISIQQIVGQIDAQMGTETRWRVHGDVIEKVEVKMRILRNLTEDKGKIINYQKTEQAAISIVRGRLEKEIENYERLLKEKKEKLYALVDTRFLFKQYEKQRTDG